MKLLLTIATSSLVLVRGTIEERQRFDGRANIQARKFCLLTSSWQAQSSLWSDLRNPNLRFLHTNFTRQCALRHILKMIWICALCNQSEHISMFSIPGLHSDPSWNTGWGDPCQAGGHNWDGVHLRHRVRRLRLHTHQPIRCWPREWPGGWVHHCWRREPDPAMCWPPQDLHHRQQNCLQSEDRTAWAWWYRVLEGYLLHRTIKIIIINAAG